MYLNVVKSDSIIQFNEKIQRDFMICRKIVHCVTAQQTTFSRPKVNFYGSRTTQIFILLLHPHRKRDTLCLQDTNGNLRNSSILDKRNLLIITLEVIAKCLF